MKKDDLKLRAFLIAIILLSGFVGFAIGIYSEREYQSGLVVSDDYQTISFHKDYKILEINEKLEDGKQYDYISVDWFRPWNSSADIFSNSYGMIHVNESTNKLEFIEWKTAKANPITIV